MISSRSEFGDLLRSWDMLGPAAEVGVAEGRYSAEILSWGVPKLYLIDLWQHVPDARGDLAKSNKEHAKLKASCLEKVAHAMDRVIILQGWAHEMADRIPNRSLTLVHLDASHDYVSVLRDLEAYWPKVMPGGIMSGHDYLMPKYGVEQAVKEFTDQRGINPMPLDTERGIENACFWFRKPQ